MGRSRHYIHPANYATLESGDAVRAQTSKKDPTVRQAELLESVSPTLIRAVIENAEVLLANPESSEAVCEILLHAKGRSSAFGPVADLVAAPYSKDHPIDRIFLNRALKRLIVDEWMRKDEVADDGAHFAPVLLERLSGRLASYLPSYGGFIVLALLESPITSAAVLAELTPQLAAIKKLGSQAAAIVARKIEDPSSINEKGGKKRKADGDDKHAKKAKSEDVKEVKKTKEVKEVKETKEAKTPAKEVKEVKSAKTPAKEVKEVKETKTPAKEVKEAKTPAKTPAVKETKEAKETKTPAKAAKETKEVKEAKTPAKAVKEVEAKTPAKAAKEVEAKTPAAKEVKETKTPAKTPAAAKEAKTPKAPAPTPSKKAKAPATPAAAEEKSHEEPRAPTPARTPAKASTPAGSPLTKVMQGAATPSKMSPIRNRLRLRTPAKPTM